MIVLTVEEMKDFRLWDEWIRQNPDDEGLSNDDTVRIPMDQYWEVMPQRVTEERSIHEAGARD